MFLLRLLEEDGQGSVNDSDKDSNPHQVPQEECTVSHPLCRGRVVKMGRSLTTARKPGARAGGFHVYVVHGKSGMAASSEESIDYSLNGV